MPQQPITYFFDESCSKRYPVNEKGQPIIDWGITIPGEKKVKTLIVRNESRDRAILRQPYSMDEDLKIVDYPKNLFSGDTGKVELTFEPKTERVDALHADWGFDIIIG